MKPNLDPIFLCFAGVVLAVACTAAVLIWAYQIDNRRREKPQHHPGLLLPKRIK